MVCSTMVLNALRRAGASGEWESREESGELGSEESRRGEWDDNGNQVECCWEDVAVVEGRLVAGESALKGCNECWKVGRGRGSCRRG